MLGIQCINQIYKLCSKIFSVYIWLTKHSFHKETSQWIVLKQCFPASLWCQVFIPRLISKDSFHRPHQQCLCPSKPFNGQRADIVSYFQTFCGIWYWKYLLLCKSSTKPWWYPQRTRWFIGICNEQNLQRDIDQRQKEINWSCIGRPHFIKPVRRTC